MPLFNTSSVACKFLEKDYDIFGNLMSIIDPAKYQVSIELKLFGYLRVRIASDFHLEKWFDMKNKNFYSGSMNKSQKEIYNKLNSIHKQINFGSVYELNEMYCLWTLQQAK